MKLHIAEDLEWEVVVVMFNFLKSRRKFIVQKIIWEDAI